jgi:hypothetical protein
VKILLLLPFLIATLPADDLRPLGDEFANSATLTRFTEHGAHEAWTTPFVEQAAIHSPTAGHFRLIPRTCAWFQNLRGTLYFKNITGNFIVTAKVKVYSRTRGNPDLPPDRTYSLAGILIRQPRAVTGNFTNPAYNWTAGGENYVFLSYGTGGDSRQRQFEIKTTVNSVSDLYYRSIGIDQTANNDAWLQIVRVGNTVVCLRKHSASSEWIVENRYPNTNQQISAFGPTIQVGLTAYTDWPSINLVGNATAQLAFNRNGISPGSPDLIADFDYIRFRRPPAALTESVLQNMSTRRTSGGIDGPHVYLSASTNAASHLGENANLPAPAQTFASWSATSGIPENPTADPDSDGLPNLLEYALARSPSSPETTPPLTATLSGGTAEIRVATNPETTDLLFEIQSRPALETGVWETVASKPAGTPWSATAGNISITESPAGEILLTDTRTPSPEKSFYRLRASRE